MSWEQQQELCFQAHHLLQHTRIWPENNPNKQTIYYSMTISEVCDQAEEQKHLLDFPLVPDELFIQ